MPHFADDVNVPAKKLGRHTSLVMAMVFLSRTFGFLRDVVLAQVFGASAAFDAFVIAFKIPNFMRRLFGEGAFVQAFVPALAAKRAQGGHESVQVLLRGVSGAFGLILLGIVLVGEIGAAVLVLILAPGFSGDPGRYHLAVDLIRMTLPYLFFIGMVAVAGAVLNLYHRFALTAFTPILLNLILIAVALGWAPRVDPRQGVIVLAWGVLISGLVQWAFQWRALRSLGLSFKPSWRWRGLGVAKILKRLLPALLGVSAAQVSLLMINWFASFLPVGSISWLYYSDRLLYFPLGIIGVALATVVMPHLSEHHQGGHPENFAATLNWALRWVCVLSIPASLGLAMLAGPIVATLMHRGAFSAYDVEMTHRSLMLFACGLPALIVIKIFAAAFYARHDTRTPLRIAGAAILLNVAANFLLMGPLAHAGLALATTLASWFNAVLLWVFLCQRQILKKQPGWWRLAAGVMLGSLLLTMMLSWGSRPLNVWLMSGAAQNCWRLLILITSGILLYMLGLWLAGLRWRHFKSAS